MKRILFTITLLSITFLATFAQKETFFADKTSAPVSISNLQGVSAEVEMLVYKRNYSPRTLFPVKISYFNEIKLGKTTSVMLSGGIMGLRSLLDYTIRPYDPVNQTGGDIYDLKYGLGLNLSVAVAPRWYFALNKATASGNDTKLVSGFYLGLPLELLSTSINSKMPVKVSLNIKPTVGYRYAINKHLFAEASAGISINKPYNGQYEKPFFADLKIGYAFK